MKVLSKPLVVISVSAQNKDGFFFFSWLLRPGKFKHCLKVVAANSDMN